MKLPHAAKARVERRKVVQYKKGEAFEVEFFDTKVTSTSNRSPVEVFGLASQSF
jgi:hypothetical protein